jgi:hypothetical protein
MHKINNFMAFVFQYPQFVLPKRLHFLAIEHNGYAKQNQLQSMQQKYIWNGWRKMRPEEVETERRWDVRVLWKERLALVWRLWEWESAKAWVSTLLRHHAVPKLVVAVAMAKGWFIPCGFVDD